MKSIFFKVTSYIGFEWLQCGFTTSDFLIGYSQFQFAVWNVDVDNITIFNNGNCATCCRFWRYVTNGCTTSSTRETPVSQQGYVFIKTHTCDHGCWCQHFTHARTTFSTFVADNFHVAFYDFTACNSFNSFFFAVEYFCWTRMNEHIRIYCTSFYNRTIFSQVAFKYSNTTSFVNWIIPRMNYVFISYISSLSNFTLCFKGYCLALRMKTTIFC